MKYTEGMLRDGALEGKNILITGGGTGLGRSMGEYFLKLGANLIITSRRLEVLQQAASEMEDSFGGSVLPLSCDVREIEQVEKMWSDANQEFGQIHGVLNNAAGNFISPTEMLSANAFQTVVDIVQKGTSNVTLTSGKHWIKNKQQGTFLNIVTTYAWTGSGYVVPSAVAKAGVLALTRSLAVEWAKYQIRSNAIAPGPFPTEGAWSRLLPGELVKKFDPAKKIPVGRVGEHQELANLAAYLMSDFSAFVNGEVVTIDGGEWLKGAGEFSHLDQIPNEMWTQLAESRKKK
ncbi:SDR family oxidoreductase [Litoribacter populi]|uniref:SDR family oxidoreductase n=1 Tax=Litoribacter populi TaxID=2598460 RepID=UPI0011815015|nr:SDR family oxidoreductase [Litoribacter populi]